ncbi:VanZ family protein [Crassaminicella profunda]|uniref:VanZ family protein n=1 Tax=Crassaminicella profunda TaxID=1286698 RepID=UPI001CA66CB0|nr:VanZ family protein [Crassaminicella profunda]QZY54158.1 VanZ family protein [Crassaminicella profunda]
MRLCQKQALRKLFCILFIAYLLYLLYLVFFSTYYGRDYHHGSYNFMPLKTISQYLFLKHGIKATIVNIGGNILAFMPLGFLYPIVWKKANKYKYILSVSLILTCFIEIVQYIVGVGTCDIDDVLLNVVGGLLGYILYKTVSPMERIIR